MIKVDRSGVMLPPALADRMAKEQAKVNEQRRRIDEGSKSSQQRAFDFSALRTARPVLNDLFKKKCAYCESALLTDPGDLENFRPKATVSDEEGKSVHEGYWWLVYDWNNLLIACGNCNRLHKRNRFPIAGPRAVPFERGDDLRKELPLLIDPCDDEPADYFWFTEGGTIQVAPETPASPRVGRLEAPPDQRANTTIKVLGLNRTELVNARVNIRTQLETVMKHLSPTEPRASRVLPRLVGPDQPYRAAASQWLAEFALTSGLRGWHREPLDELLPEFGAVRAVVERVIARHKTPRTPARVPRKPTVAPKKKRSVVPPSKAAAPVPATARPVFIKRIEIRNFKGIKRLDLDLPIIDTAPNLSSLTTPESIPNPDDRSAPSRVGWYVLLGENSVGKSSVLEAVALALLGHDNLQKLSGDTEEKKRIFRSKLLHQPAGVAATGKKAPRAAACTIRLVLEPSDLGEISLRITRDASDFGNGGDLVPTLIRGYGYVRLLPRTEENKSPDPNQVILARCDNLFDPRAPLCDAERWMASLQYDEKETSQFDVAARTILELLPKSAIAGAIPESEADVEDAYLKPKDGRVVMVLKQRELSLDQLSAGYQSVIALAADIIAGIPLDRLFDIRDCPGIVLLDEIGTQLHPRWRMHAINDLRRAFPGMQFIATTHEPLCLKGVAGREVAVLRRASIGDEISVVTDGVHDPRAMRVDQLLTSPLFGLDSTIDPDVDRLFQQYFALLARGGDLTDPEKERKQQLERLLAPHRGLGYTRSDQIVYALLEEYLANEGAKNKSDAAVVPNKIRQQVFDIWQNVRAYRRPNT